jgi:hypothetical protein
MLSEAKQLEKSFSTMKQTFEKLEKVADKQIGKSSNYFSPPNGVLTVSEAVAKSFKHYSQMKSFTALKVAKYANNLRVKSGGPDMQATCGGYISVIIATLDAMGVIETDGKIIKVAYTVHIF